MIIETVKVIDNNKKSFYLYHGGALRSHTLYTEADELHKINFKQQNYDLSYLNGELKRINKLNKYNEAKIVSIEVDSEYKHIKDIEDLFSYVKFMSSDELLRTLSNDTRDKLMTIMIESYNEEFETEKKGGYNAPEISFYYQDKQDNKYIAVDNTTNDCWVEEFSSEDKASDWVKGENDEKA